MLPESILKYSRNFLLHQVLCQQSNHLILVPSSHSRSDCACRYWVVVVATDHTPDLSSVIRRISCESTSVPCRPRLVVSLCRSCSVVDSDHFDHGLVVGEPDENLWDSPFLCDLPPNEEVCFVLVDGCIWFCGIEEQIEWVFVVGVFVPVLCVHFMPILWE